MSNCLKQQLETGNGKLETAKAELSPYILQTEINCAKIHP